MRSFPMADCTRWRLPFACRQSLRLRSLAERWNHIGRSILRRTLAALAVCYWLAYTTWWNWHGLDLRTGLPLQVCDFNGLIAPLALLSGWRFVRATLYFWTAALTLQAFIQPALTAGPAALVFWAFWMAHTLIAACAVYDIVVLGLSPLLERSRPRPDRERLLCRARGADQSLARRQLWLSRQSGGRERDSALCVCLGTLAAARDHPGCARAAWLRRRRCCLGLSFAGGEGSNRQASATASAQSVQSEATAFSYRRWDRVRSRRLRPWRLLRDHVRDLAVARIDDHELFLNHREGIGLERQARRCPPGQ